MVIIAHDITIRPQDVEEYVKLRVVIDTTNNIIVEVNNQKALVDILELNEAIKILTEKKRGG